MPPKKSAKKATNTTAKKTAKKAAEQPLARKELATAEGQSVARTIRIHPPPCLPGEIEIDDPATAVKMCVVPATAADVAAIHPPPCIQGLEIEFDDPITGKKMCKRI